MKTIAIALLAAAAIGPLPSFAQSMGPGWYVGAGVGRGKANISAGDTGGFDTQVDDSDTAYTVRAGWRFHPNAAVELGYWDFGKYGFHSSEGGFNASSRASSIGLSVVGIVPLDAFDVYGRVGYARTDSRSKVRSNAILGDDDSSSKDKQNEAIYGVGAHWNANRQWGVFLEWQRNDKSELDAYLIGVDFRF